MSQLWIETGNQGASPCPVSARYGRCSTCGPAAAPAPGPVPAVPSAPAPAAAPSQTSCSSASTQQTTVDHRHCSWTLALSEYLTLLVMLGVTAGWLQCCCAACVAVWVVGCCLFASVRRSSDASYMSFKWSAALTVYSSQHFTQTVYFLKQNNTLIQ